MPRKPTYDEISLFRSAVDGTKPLNNDEKIQAEPKSTNVKVARKEKTIKNKAHDFIDNDFLETKSPESYLFYQDPSISYKIIRKLHQGQYNAEATLDLHGCTVQEAAQLTSNFLNDCSEQNIRSALIIHGKGRNARIKTQLASWLKCHHQILAYCTAQAKHGGAGALHVLLKNPKKGENIG